MIVPTTTYLDDVSLATIGFVLGRPGPALRGARDVVSHERARLAIPTKDGGAYTESRAMARERTFTLAGTLIAADAPTLLANYRLLEYMAGAPTVRVRLADDASREIVASLREITFEYLGVKLGSHQASVHMQWEAVEDPCWRAISATVVALSTTAAACALGTAESWPSITVNGAGSAVDVLFLTSGDVEVARMELSSISGGQSVVIDMLTRTITHSSTGVTPSLRTGGRFFPLDPRQGNYATSTWPKLQLSAGTGSASYRQRFRV